MKPTETKRIELFSKTFLSILLIISILTNFVLIAKLKSPNMFNAIRALLLPAPKVLPTDHVRGNSNAKFTVIEYADFQCPYCAKMHEAMKSIMKEADTRWVFRQFPLPGHPLAAKAAEAAECAGDQGKFWEYSDALFELKAPMAEGTFLKTAQDLGLDWMVFSVCLNSGKYSSVVAAQHEAGVKNKITGTPTFYLNGKRFDGFVPLEDLRKLMGVKEGK